MDFFFTSVTHPEPMGRLFGEESIARVRDLCCRIVHNHQCVA